MVQCDTCGVEAGPGPGLAVRERGPETSHRCIYCRRREFRDHLLRLTALSAPVVALAVAAALAVPDTGRLAPLHAAGWATLNWLVLGPLLAAGALALRGGVHAVFARLFGFQLFRVEIGVGTELLRLRLRDVDCVLRWLPVSGRIHSATPDPRLLRACSWVIAFSSPLALLALAGAANLLPGAADAHHTLRDIAPGCVLLYVSLALLLLNLVPLWRAERPGLRDVFESDGWLLLSLPLRSRSWAREACAGYFACMVERCLDRGELDAARRWAGRGLQLLEASATLELTLAQVELRSGENESARARLAHCLESLAESDPRRPLVAARLALAHHLGARLELLAQSKALLDTAQSRLGFHPEVIAARAAWELDRGHPNDAVALFWDALWKTSRLHDKALIRAGLARAEARSGRLAEARAHLTVAQGLDADCALLKVAQHELAAAAAQRSESEGELTGDGAAVRPAHREPLEPVVAWLRPVLRPAVRRYLVAGAVMAIAIGSAGFVARRPLARAAYASLLEEQATAIRAALPGDALREFGATEGVYGRGSHLVVARCESALQALLPRIDSLARVLQDDPLWRAESRTLVGHLRFCARRTEEALVDLEAARADWEEVARRFERRLAGLAPDETSALPWEREGLGLARHEHELGRFHQALGRVLSAEASYRSALSLSSALMQRAPPAARIELEGARRQMKLALTRLLLDANRLAEAHSLLLEVLASVEAERKRAFEREPAAADESPGTGSVADLGQLDLDLGRLQTLANEIDTRIRVQQLAESESDY